MRTRQVAWLVSIAAAGLLACAAPAAEAPASKTPSGEPEGPLAVVKSDLANFNKRMELPGGRPLYKLAKTNVRYFVAPARCGQGPYEFQIHIPFASTEPLELWANYALAPRKLRGRFEAASPVGTGGGAFSNDAPDNGRCVLGVNDEAAAKRDAVARDPGAATVPLPPPPRTPGGEVTPGPVTALVEIAAPSSWPSGRHYSLGGAIWHTRDPESLQPRSITRDLVFKIWFDTPNDLEGVVFVVEQATAVLTISDAEFAAFAADQERRSKERRAQEDRDNERFVAQQRLRDANCAQHHEDRDCWPEGYEQTMARRAEEQRKAQAQVRRREEEEKHRPPPGPPKEPDRPPPAAQAETPPPRPSTNATWIAGYWLWTEGRWWWLAGRWRVPDEDIKRELTVHAPTPPPAPRVEPPPAPRPEVVWTPGFWQWDGARWVWVMGTWQKPPTPAATWMPDRWRPRIGGAVFLPGRWKVEIGARPPR